MDVLGYTEDISSWKNGIKYYIDGVGSVILRRGGLSGWHTALVEATEEVLGMDCNHNFIDPEQNETINMKACANYLVVALCDDFKADGQNVVPNTLSNIRAIFENKGNYSLVLELIEQSCRSELFLKERLKEEAEQLKKS